MTFLDERIRQVRDETAHDLVTACFGPPALNLVANAPLSSLPYPPALDSKMKVLVNNKEALKVFLRDRTSAGNAVAARFLAKYMHYLPAVEPEEFDACPVLLTHPPKITGHP